MTPARYLADTSVIGRIDDDLVAEVLLPLIQAGLVGVTIVTELEAGYSARSTTDYLRSRRRVFDYLLPVPLPMRAESRAREVQAALVERGQHRAVSIADLLIGATAEIEQIPVLHYDADFDLIADITGQAMEWVVPRGSIP